MGYFETFTINGTSYFHPYDYDVTPWKALKMLSHIKSGDIILPTTDGRTIRLRRISEPDQNVSYYLKS